MLWSPNTQLHYPFENTAKDYSGQGRDGTLEGTPACTYATKPNGGRCLYFGGAGYITTPSFALSGTVVWFAAWVRCKLIAANAQMLIACGGASPTAPFIQCYRLTNSGRLDWGYADGTNIRVASANNYFDSPYNDVWLHLCVICDYAGKATYFYRNGLPFGSPVTMSNTPAFPSSANIKYLGGLFTVALYYPLVDGYMANVILGTLATKPPDAELTANANRLMLGLNPIWSV
jgi:hypothetical protein